ncbi:MAG: hypothetical protein AVDCRST_MAG19-2944 [uncultured Thermomicrobiales bacterium]|uniref:3-carboxymuconate cyclase n=1 Tax=uncultured Thermomicrobiales bacterium TaxID=1645740 RepID=A0A6J4V9X7_9BACT|nr:MAG: hypothetical protein AVDCRST_MAG19-2944 [uncultured Thermomicrobiales bacterium]
MLNASKIVGSGARRAAWPVAAVGLLLGGTAPALAQDGVAPPAPVGAVYAMTNSLAGNEVVVFDRAEDGSLSGGAHVPTGGEGSGSFENSDTPLIVASAEGQSSPVDLGGGSDFVFAVNAGSDSISSFAVTEEGLELVEVQDSGAERPTSLTANNGMLYVLNSAGDAGGAGLCFGGNPSVTGFTIAETGELEPIPDSTVELSGGPDSGCAQVSFTPGGGVLLVSQITQNTITAFPVNDDGTLGEAVENEPTGNGPFGYTFDGEGRLHVTENFQAAPGAASVASYEIARDGTLEPIGESVTTGETDPCWILVTPDGRFAFVANFGPSGLLEVESEEVRRGTISSFAVGEDGSLAVLEAQAAQVGVGAADIAFAGDGAFLYALNTAAGTVSGFAIGEEGELTLVTAVGGLPTNPIGPLPPAMGLAARDNG